MNRILRFFRGLRGKLTLTYTLVTVMALLALEVLVLVSGLLFSNLTDTDTRDYLNDVIYTLAPEARAYLQPGKQDLAGLQSWLQAVYRSGHASMDPQNIFDSPRADLITGEPMFVLDSAGTVLAQAPASRADLLGRRYTAPSLPGADEALEAAMDGSFDAMQLIARTPDNNYFMAVPIGREGMGSEPLGVLVVTIKPPPPMFLQVWPTLLGWVVITGVLLLMAVIPFGTLFGYIMSRGLTRRLAMLTRAVDAWSEGDFRPMPPDRSTDEIGYLSMRMRHMAERVQTLLQTQQQLAMMEERNHLARELHDTVKQQAFATLMQVRAARNRLDGNPQEALEHLEAAEALIKTTQQELGMIIAELRPAALDGQGLAGALRAYAETWSRHSRVPTEVSISEERALPLEIEQALYRVAQEALSNIARHSRASAASIRLTYHPSEVTLVIADNGAGFDAAHHPSGGFGLRSMQERMATIHGALSVESACGAAADGTGTTITARAPLQERKPT